MAEGFQLATFANLGISAVATAAGELHSHGVFVEFTARGVSGGTTLELEAPPLFSFAHERYVCATRLWIVETEEIIPSTCRLIAGLPYIQTLKLRTKRRSRCMLRVVLNGSRSSGLDVVHFATDIRDDFLESD